MTNKDFEDMIYSFRAAQDNLLKTKGADYTQKSDDRLSNFKDVAKLLGLTPLQVWSIYWLKHVFAICTYVQTGKLESEGIMSRFLDAANYGLLGIALVEEELNQILNTEVDKRVSKAEEYHYPSIRKPDDECDIPF